MLDRIRVLIPLRRHLSSLAGSYRAPDDDCPEPGPEGQRTSDDGSGSDSGQEDMIVSALARQMLIGHPLTRPSTPASQADLSTVISTRQKELLIYLTGPAPPSVAPSVAPSPSHSSPLLSVLPPLAPPTRTAFGPLVLNSQWTGKQFSEEKSYAVHVKVIHLDLDNGSGSGVLDIKGLTEEWPTMTTFFDIEVIGPHHDFLTNAWDSSENCDYDHWSKFPSFSTYISHLQSSSALTTSENKKPIDTDDPVDRLSILRNSTWNHGHCDPKTGGADSSNTSELTRNEINQWWFDQPFLFMRWKERFLVNDYKKQEIDGASFAGFYYVCLQIPQSTTDLEKDQDVLGIQKTRPEDAQLPLEAPGTDCPGSPSSSTGSTSPTPSRDFARRASTPPPSASLRGAHDASCPAEADGSERLDSGALLEDPARGWRPRDGGGDEKIQTLVSGEGRTVKPHSETQPVAKQTPAECAAVEELNCSGEGLARGGEKVKMKWGWEEATIQGFYYHPKSEPYQELVLKFDDCFGQDLGLGDARSRVDHDGSVGEGDGESERRSGYGSATYQIC